MKSYLLLLFAIALITTISSSRASPFSHLFGSSDDNVRVIFLADFENSHDKLDFYSNPTQVVPIGLANGSQYHCHIPQRISTEASDENWRKHLAKLQDRPLPDHFSKKINAALSELCFTYPKDWWTYRLCWNKNVRQFHADTSGKVEMEFYLGKGPDMDMKDGATREFLYDVDPTDPTRARLISEWFNGTSCDVTKRDREMILYLKCPAAAKGSSSTSTSGNKQGNTFTTVESAGQLNPYLQAQFQVEERAGTCVYEAALTHEVFCMIPELRPREKPESLVRCISVGNKNDEENNHKSIEIRNFEEVSDKTSQLGDK